MAAGVIAGAAAGAAAAGAATLQARVVMGPIVVVEPSEFLRALSLAEQPLVVEVRETRGVISKRTVYVYVASVRGNTFITRSEDRLDCKGATVVEGRRLVLPPPIRQYV